MAKYGTRATSNAVAELAYRYAEKNWRQIRYKNQPEDFRWDALRDNQKLNIIKASHASLDKLPPAQRFPLIDELDDAWKQRNGVDDSTSDSDS